MRRRSSTTRLGQCPHTANGLLGGNDMPGLRPCSCSRRCRSTFCCRVCCRFSGHGGRCPTSIGPSRRLCSCSRSRASCVSGSSTASRCERKAGFRSPQPSSAAMQSGGSCPAGVRRPRRSPCRCCGGPVLTPVRRQRRSGVDGTSAGDDPGVAAARAAGDPRRRAHQPQPCDRGLSRSGGARAARRRGRIDVRDRQAGRARGPLHPVVAELDHPASQARSPGFPRTLLADRDVIRTTLGERWRARF